MSCSTCSNLVIFARGLCRRCYQAQRRSGALQRVNVQNTGTCSTEGCGKPAFAKNLCKNCYDRARHPLNNTWRLLRTRYIGAYPPSWDRFDAFLADVGERPTPKHQLRRKDMTQPFSTTNIRWIEPVVRSDPMTRDGRAAYEREWRFQRKFGISVADYDRLMLEQDGRCASCREAELHIHRSGKKRDLAVDHDHATGIVRGLLCGDCNRGLGLFRDDPVALRAAADYLEAHASKIRCEGVPS